MKYSFVIPAYQCKFLLKNTLQALNYQEGFGREDYEVVVIDDGSTDGTEAYISGIADNYVLKYIYLERCPVSSRSRARNFGIRAAKGRIIIFIDADIIVRPDYLREVERCYALESKIILAGQRLMLMDEIPLCSIVDKSIFMQYKPGPGQRELLEFRYGVFNELSYNAARMRYPFIFGLTCNMAVPREEMEKSGGFDEDLIAWGMEDIEAAYRLFKAGLPFIINSRMYVLHQFHGPNTSIVAEHLQEGVKENTRLFLKKHPGIFEISEAKVYDLFLSIATRFRDIEQPAVPYTGDTVIDFKDRESLMFVKKNIEQYSAEEGRTIVVNDYLEDTDLDIWIQLLGKRKSTPVYFPMSKCLREQENNAWKKVK